MKVGVFDSGVGGLSVVRAIKKARPDLEVSFANDSSHVPYGTKQPQEILGYVLPVLKTLVDDGCQVLVIACNTVSTTLIKDLRREITIPLIAMEPKVKPAAEQTKTGVVAVCATPTTLTSKRYHWLKDTYAKGIKVLEPDCSRWSGLIENNTMDKKTIDTMVQEVTNQKADIIVLGCTHYHWIEEEIQKSAGNRAKVLQPETAIIERLEAVLSQFA